MTDQNETQDQTLGFQFEPHENSLLPSYKCLAVHIRDEPTRRHFDPELFSLNIVTEEEFVDLLNVYHPWTLFGRYKVTAGHVSLTDRRGKKVIAFTFGGEMMIETQEDQTICTLYSPAPILKYTNYTDFAYMFANYTEILLAKIRAAWLPGLLQYEKMLVETPPLILYIIALRIIRNKFQHFPIKDNEHLQEFLSLLDSELDTLYRSPMPRGYEIILTDTIITSTYDRIVESLQMI